uniref:LarC family nickel insertion protein n=1 Tax=Mantoniella antarctica TaxID=81844 RepID=A0A7S0SK56_9CHLO
MPHRTSPSPMASASAPAAKKRLPWAGGQAVARLVGRRAVGRGVGVGSRVPASDADSRRSGGAGAVSLRAIDTHGHTHSHGDHSHGQGGGHSHSHGDGDGVGGADDADAATGVVASAPAPASADISILASSPASASPASWPPPAPHSVGGDSTLWTPRNPPLERGAGAGKVLFVDAYTAGVAGDMFVAALLDLGVPLLEVQTQLAHLGIAGYTLTVLGTERSAIAAPRFLVTEDGPAPQPLRDFRQIRALLEASALAPGAKHKALRAFTLLAEGESSVHGVPVEQVHFHEVGAVDSIVDIVAVAVGLDFLGADEVIVSPLPMGRGVLRGAAHGPLPSPPPATVSCLCGAGVPTFDAGVDGELVTPTGACLVAALKTGVSRWPDMFMPSRCSYGAGTKRWPDRPNLLRLVLGERAGRPSS